MIGVIEARSTRRGGSMQFKQVASVLGFMALALALSGSTCGGGDDCAAAKQHMCEKIYGVGCYPGVMGNAREKIRDACGEAELEAYLPVVSAACAPAMDCPSIAGKTYASAPAGGAGGGSCDGGVSSMKFTYSGTATADGRAAQLEFTVTGSAVSGRLQATAVCGDSIRLPRTDVTFTGTLSGTWESSSGSISATWTGGDYACDGTQLSPPAFPTSGSLTIVMGNGKVTLQRISGGLPYEFAPSNKKYAPASCIATPDSGARDSRPDTASADLRMDALGPVCSKLAACCPTITDNPALRQDCYTTLANGLGDPGCQITWNSLTRLRYCQDAGL
jgi:hypothetical protein